MANVKVATLFVITLLLLSTLTFAARPEPASVTNNSPANTQQGVDSESVDEIICEGIGEDECLTRRTLAAHTDYIYTQKHKP
ncbi:phytosulfokines 3-like [Melia azedarach]|uniref:Phytosulfokines 3-like n=1 Tax=Melia azedarach TaxID=155640 RepID=A0ACC1XTB2_MELAZ|nr:phytosulfokines 3-like [Melia azedarach]